MLDVPGREFVELEPLVSRRHRRRAKRLRHIRHSSQLTTDAYHTLPEFTDHGIPAFLQNSYLSGSPMPKITSLRDWQKDLFQKSEWQNGQNAVVVVPTSGGKTLAADVAIARHLENDPESKAIYALPFVSLASEKTTEYRERFKDFQVRPFYQNIGGPDFRRGSIAVCTYEKVHSLLNCAIRDEYIEKLKVVVIDEIHMIGEAHRGSVIEAIIVKLLLLRPNVDIQILGLTATLNRQDTERLANWIRGYAYFSADRPSRIKHFFMTPEGHLHQLENNTSREIMQVSSIKEDMRKILAPIRTRLVAYPSSIIIVFVNTRKQTVQLAEFIAQHLYQADPQLPEIQQPSQRLVASRDLIVQRLTRTETGLDASLGFCVKRGVGFHHAGMLLEERKLIEDAARASTISVVVATTTLSAGINIRSVSRVIICDIYRSGGASGKALIPGSVYTQMAGRAGRDERVRGDVFVLARSNEKKELDDAVKLATQELESIRPQLLEDRAADRFFLQCLVTGLCSPEKGLDTFVHATLYGSSSSSTDEVRRLTNEISDRLRALGLIEQDSVAATPLGRAIAGSSMSIEEGLDLKEAIDNMQNNLCLRDEVHLLYLCVPPSTTASETTPSYDSRVWDILVDEHEEVIRLVTSLDGDLLRRHMAITRRNGGKHMNSEEMAKHDKELDRLFFACLLQKLIAEQSVNDIVKLFNITRGSVQNLQMQAATFAGQSVRFCEATGSRTLGRALNSFKERLNFGVRNELLPLMKLPSCDRQTARLFVTNRISSPLELAELSEEAIAEILAQKRGDDRPFAKEKELAKRLRDEAKLVADSLTIIDEFEGSAITAAAMGPLVHKPC